jgi:hypothetical protein
MQRGFCSEIWHNTVSAVHEHKAKEVCTAKFRFFSVSIYNFTSELLKRFGLNLAPRQKVEGQTGLLLYPKASFKRATRITDNQWDTTLETFNTNKITHVFSALPVLLTGFRKLSPYTNLKWSVW